MLVCFQRRKSFFLIIFQTIYNKLLSSFWYFMFRGSLLWKFNFYSLENDPLVIYFILWNSISERFSTIKKFKEYYPNRPNIHFTGNLSVFFEESFWGQIIVSSHSKGGQIYPSFITLHLFTQAKVHHFN